MAVVGGFPRGAELDEAVSSAHRSWCASHAGLLAAIGEHDRTEAWAAAGARDEVAYLVRELDVERNTARDWVRAARYLARFPEWAESLADAVVSGDYIAQLAALREL